MRPRGLLLPAATVLLTAASALAQMPQIGTDKQIRSAKQWAAFSMVVLTATSAVYGQATGSVTGTVFENGVRPLAGARVTYIAQGHYEIDSRHRLQFVRPQVGGSVTSGADGTFAIGALPPGGYIVCAQGTVPVHVGSCAWTNVTPIFRVSAGKATSGLMLSVSRGALLDIAIADPSGCAAKNTRAAVELFGNSTGVPARFNSTSGGMVHYLAVVPQQTALRLSASHPCSIQDSSGNTARSVAGLAIPPVQGESAAINLTAR
jgi:hypothetical protein